MNKKMVTIVAVIVLGAIIAIGAIGSGQTNGPSGSTTSSSSSSSSAAQPSKTAASSATTFTMASTCRSVGGLPDPNCTPGATNPDVTQANIQSTICVSGYTETIRPPTSYTDPLKVQSIRAYGYNDTNVADYEEDHLIALEIGGSPTSVANLWAEPHYGTYTSLQKDSFENYLHTQVCTGKITLSTAQNEIATNWVQNWLASGGVSSSISTTTALSSSSSVSGQIGATISYANNPIVRGKTQTVTIAVTNSTGPIVGHLLAVHVTYASLQTTKDLSCTTSTSGSCSVSWLIGTTSNPGTFAVTVVDTVSGATFSSSFEVTTA